MPKSIDMLYMLEIYVINRILMCINDIRPTTKWDNIALINIEGESIC